jgi:hypothetical protein
MDVTMAIGIENLRFSLLGHNLLPSGLSVLSSNMDVTMAIGIENLRFSA